MISMKRRMSKPATIGLLATMALALSPCVRGGRAEAQYGIGFGGGYGGFGFGFQNNAYQDTQFLNSWSLQNAASAAANRPQPLTAPRFQTRDDGFYDRYDLATRESMINRVARNPGREMGTADRTGTINRPPSRPSTPAASSTPPAQPSPPATVNLAAFFNKDDQLVWPSVSPITGDFGKKQSTADLATLAVRNEYELRGLAQLSTVTDARQKLLDYGRPALQYVREQSTPALADSFHVFLLSLYGNIGNAATVPKAP